MSFLSNLKTDGTIKEQGDSLGGGFVLDSGVYDMVVDMAYINLSAGGAYGLVCVFKSAEGKTLKQTFWMTGGTAKGQLNYYVDKDGNKQYLPGFSQANALALLTVGKEIAECEPEKKMVKAYNPDLKKEVPTEKDVLTEMIGQPIKLGVIKQIVDKTTKAPDGTYQPTGETREENDIDKIFHAETGCTVTELRNGQTEAGFLPKWEEKWKGEVKNRAKGVKDAGKPGVPGTSATTSAPKKSLFGNAAA